MIVDDVEYIQGKGTVVKGQIQKGSVFTGDTIFCVGLPIMINGIEKDNQIVKSAQAGDFVKLIFNIPKGMIEKGDILERI